MSILKSTDLMKFCVLIYYIQCLDIAVIAYLTMFLELDNINNNVIEQVIGFVSVRMMTNVFFYLTLDT